MLPPLGTSDRALLKQLPNANKIGGVTKLMSTHLKEGVKGMHSVKEMMEAARDSERSLTPKQCAVLDSALDAIKEVGMDFCHFKLNYFMQFSVSMPVAKA